MGRGGFLELQCDGVGESRGVKESGKEVISTIVLDDSSSDPLELDAQIQEALLSRCVRWCVGEQGKIKEM